MMRIITGRARGVRLTTLAGEHTRPTSERAKEAVFSVLQFDILGKNVLDLFAGSGQLGLEAVSRGARTAVLCDASKAAVGVIRENAIKTKLLPDCEILGMDWEAALHNFQGRRRFGLVFLDPPYALGVLPKVLTRLLDDRLLEDGARIVCESAAEEDVFFGNADLRDRFEILRTARYGAAFVTILTPKGGEVEA